MSISVLKALCGGCNLGDCVCPAIAKAERHNRLVDLIRENNLLTLENYLVVYCTNCDVYTPVKEFNILTPPLPGNTNIHVLIAEAEDYIKGLSDLACRACLNAKGNYLEVVSFETNRATFTETVDPRNV